MSICCKDSVNSVALLCRRFLALRLPPELDRLAAGFSDLLGGLALVNSAPMSTLDLAGETSRSVMLLLMRLGDSTGFEAMFSPATFRTCFTSCVLLLIADCFLGVTLPVLLVDVCGLTAVWRVAMSARLDIGRGSATALGNACFACDDA